MKKVMTLNDQGKEFVKNEIFEMALLGTLPDFDQLDFAEREKFIANLLPKKGTAEWLKLNTKKEQHEDNK